VHHNGHRGGIHALLMRPCACIQWCSQTPSRPASSQRTTGARAGRPQRRVAWAMPWRKGPWSHAATASARAVDQAPECRPADRGRHAVQRLSTGHARLWYHTPGGSLAWSWACSSLVLTCTGMAEKRTHSDPCLTATGKHRLSPHVARVRTVSRPPVARAVRAWSPRLPGTLSQGRAHRWRTRGAQRPPTSQGAVPGAADGVTTATSWPERRTRRSG